MADIFISYSRKDGDFARRLTNELVKAGCRLVERNPYRN